jgi:hypothetical protein
LFVHYPHLPDESPEDTRDKLEKAVFNLRQKALEEILNKEGLARIMDLAEVADSPRDVGFVLAKANLFEKDSDIIPQLLSSEIKNVAEFASGFVLGRFRREGNDNWDWVNSLPLAKWSAEEAAKFVLALQCFEPKSWELVTQLGDNVTKYYWDEVPANYIEPKKEDVEYAALKLVEYNRPVRAIDLLNTALFRKCDLSSSTLMNALDAGLDSWQDEKNREPIPNDIWYDVQQLIKKLQDDSKDDPNFDIRRLASLEWGYLGFLDGHGVSPATLHKSLQTNPSFFAEILGMIYRSRKEQSDSAETPTEKQKAKAENAYTLLYNWKTIPGILEDGTVDEQILMDWVNKAREICEESGRLEICDVKVGELFARATNKESDGSWPCIPVRDVIEEIGSDALEEGFEVGTYNKRGTITRSLFEGGGQERELASQYKSYAEACEIEWPRTASVLRRVAKSYEERARREDEQTKDRL